MAAAAEAAVAVVDAARKPRSRAMGCDDAWEATRDVVAAASYAGRG